MYKIKKDFKSIIETKLNKWLYKMSTFSFAARII